MKKDARFYFGNLLADVMRCIIAAANGNEGRYADSFGRAEKTLGFLRTAHRPEAYEEGLLLLRALSHAKARGRLDSFRTNLSSLMQSFASV